MVVSTDRRHGTAMPGSSWAALDRRGTYPTSVHTRRPRETLGERLLPSLLLLLVAFLLVGVVVAAWGVRDPGDAVPSAPVVVPDDARATWGRGTTLQHPRPPRQPLTLQADGGYVDVRIGDPTSVVDPRPVSWSDRRGSDRVLRLPVNLTYRGDKDLAPYHDVSVALVTSTEDGGVSVGDEDPGVFVEGHFTLHRPLTDGQSARGAVALRVPEAARDTVVVAVTTEHDETILVGPLPLPPPVA